MRTQPQDIIARLEADNSKLAKQAIIQEAVEENLTEFFDGLRMALDTLYTFGVKKVPVKEEAGGQGLPWQAFVYVAEKLHSRELTGHAARDAILLAMDTATQEQWNGYYRRILIKDLRCGMSEKTVNKVCKAAKREDLGIPVFSCQLAHDSANHEKKMKGKKLIDVKLDGVRMLAIVSPNGTAETFSRNGKEFTNFPKLISQFEEYAPGLDEHMVFDGEVMSGSFQDLMKQVHRKDNAQTDDAKFCVFDMIPLKDFLKGKYEVPQQQRADLLAQTLERAYNSDMLANVEQIEYEEVDLDTPEGQTTFANINRAALEHGLEGIMVKDPDAIYECKRSHAWLKMKPFIELTLTIVGAEEGTGKNLGKLGAFVFEGTEDGKLIRVNVGGGYSDKQREDYWKYRDEAMGLLGEVRADAITQNQDGSYSLRFPRFKTFRGHAPGEKI